MNPSAILTDLIGALEFVSEETRTYFDRQAGRIVIVDSHILSAVEEGEEESLEDAPEWQEEEIETAKAIAEDSGGRFIDAPDPFDFHEYRHMEQFIQSLEGAQTADLLWQAIKGRGAFRYFKDMLHRLGIQEEWYSYREEAMKEFVIEWAKENDVTYADDTKGKRHLR